jgi:hypothetical protein
MRDSSYNSQRPTSAEHNSVAERANDRHSMADLNNQLYRAYLSGDGAAVERIMTLMQSADEVAV